jgi:hypothetical protein
MVKIEKKVSQTTYCMDEAMKSNDSFDYDAKINELRKINERLEKLEKFIDPDSLMTVDEYIEMCDMFCGGSITGGRFTPGEPTQSNGCSVTKNDVHNPNNGRKDNL